MRGKWKTILAIILILTFCFGMLPVAAADPTIKVVGGEAVEGTETEVTVTISLENNPGIASMKLVLSYNTSVLTFVSAAIGSDFAGLSTAQVNATNPNAGKVWLNFALVTGQTDLNATFATVVFKTAATADAGDYPLNVSYDPDDVCDVDFNNVTFAVVSGSVMIRHALAYENERSATCTETGCAAHYYCTVCGQTFQDAAGTVPVSDADLVIPALSHALTAVSKQDPTCTAKGKAAHWRCSRCSKLFSDAQGANETTEAALEIEALGHSLTHHDEEAATCTATGKKEYWNCSRCSKLFINAQGTTETTEAELVIPALDHNWNEGRVTTDPSCLNPGVKTFTCTRDASHTKTEPVSALGHSLVYHSGVAATCMETGKKEYWSCSRCGKLFSDANGETETTEAGLVTSALGHDLVHHDTAEPTCEEKGTQEHWSCSRCGKLFSDANGKTETTLDELAILPLGHDLVYHVAKDATCTELGNKVYWSCSRDEKVFGDAEGKTELTLEDVTIAALGHDWGEWTVTKEATLSEEGERQRVCKTDPTHVETEVIEKLTPPTPVIPYTDIAGTSSSSTETVTTNEDGSTTKTVKNEDGSTTETVTNTDGSTKETVTNTDGSTEETVTNTDGTTETTNVAADGSTATVKTDAEGNVTKATAEITAEAIAAAEEQPITLNLELSTSKERDEAPELNITIPEEAGSVKVEIPVKEVSASSVVVLVHEDGTEEIVPKAAMTDDGLSLEIAGNVTVKIVDNQKEFNDVDEEYWGNEAIDFVTSRELFQGTGEDTFAPETTMTRAMIVTVLYRMESKPEVENEQNFADVPAGQWFTDAVNWASSNDIIQGYGENFGKDDPVTREQLVLMLYRMAGKPETELVETGASSWAAEAMSWAVSIGLIQGDGNGYNAQETATRAETATLLMRYINL